MLISCAYVMTDQQTKKASPNRKIIDKYSAVHNRSTVIWSHQSLKASEIKGFVLLDVLALCSIGC